MRYAGGHCASEGSSSWVISNRSPSTTINTAWGRHISPDRKRRYLRLSASSTSILSAGVICTVGSLIEKLQEIGDASTEMCRQTGHRWSRAFRSLLPESPVLAPVPGLWPFPPCLPVPKPADLPGLGPPRASWSWGLELIPARRTWSIKR